jgi:hypothetical protein
MRSASLRDTISYSIVRTVPGCIVLPQEVLDLTYLNVDSALSQSHTRPDWVAGQARSGKRARRSVPAPETEGAARLVAKGLGLADDES